MQHVERYILTKSGSKSEYLALVDLCHKTKNLYNFANYIMRQCVSGKLENIQPYADLVTEKAKTVKSKKTGEEKTYAQRFISEYGLSKRLCAQKQTDYTAVKAQVAQQTIALLFKAYKAFYKVSADYAKHPKKYLGRPSLPKYKEKDGLSVAVFTNQCAAIDKNGNVRLSKNLKLKTVRTALPRKGFKQVRVVPKLDHFVIEIVYEKTKGEYTEQAIRRNKRTHSAAIDIGVDNLATVTSDNEEAYPFIVNGRALKSINQQYNKLIAKTNKEYSYHGIRTGAKLKRINSKRNRKVDDFMHKASRRVVDWCILNNVGTLYIGHNDGWKQNCGMGRTSNQSFVQIPFNKFIQKVMYKCEEVGIRVALLNEAYTSKCSALDSEKICRHEEYVGKRVERGLFVTKDGMMLNADVNGSLNILRLGAENEKTLRSAKVFNPVKLRDVNEVCDVAYFKWRPADRGRACRSCGFTTAKDSNKV